MLCAAPDRVRRQGGCAGLRRTEADAGDSKEHHYAWRSVTANDSNKAPKTNASLEEAPESADAVNDKTLQARSANRTG